MKRLRTGNRRALSERWWSRFRTIERLEKRVGGNGGESWPIDPSHGIELLFVLRWTGMEIYQVTRHG
jgi:hypothetical protein